MEPYSTARELDRWYASRNLDAPPQRPNEPESTALSSPIVPKIDEREEDEDE